MRLSQLQTQGLSLSPPSFSAQAGPKKRRRVGRQHRPLLALASSPGRGDGAWAWMQKTCKHPNGQTAQRQRVGGAEHRVAVGRACKTAL